MGHHSYEPPSVLGNNHCQVVITLEENNDVLLKYIERWKKQLDSRSMIGTIPEDLWKHQARFYLHDLLVTKLVTEDIFIDAIFYICDIYNLGNGLEINNIGNLVKIFINGVPERSKLNATPFDIF